MHALLAGALGAFDDFLFFGDQILELVDLGIELFKRVILLGNLFAFALLRLLLGDQLFDVFFPFLQTLGFIERAVFVGRFIEQQDDELFQIVDDDFLFVVRRVEPRLI